MAEIFTESEELRELAEKLINSEFKHLQECRIAYLYSDNEKHKDGKTVFADTTKVTDKVKAVCHYDFVITFYEPNTVLISDEAMELLMRHELMHVGFDDAGKCSIIPHDIEDFRAIIDEFGIDWIKN